MSQLFRIFQGGLRFSHSKCVFLVLLALATVFPYTVPALQGDVNGDGIVTQSDADRMHQYLVAQAALTSGALGRADMNGDSRVDIADLVAIRLAMTEASPSSLPLAMLPVPAGSFVMGARDDEFNDADELPRHDVTLSAYHVGKFEVTNGQYSEVLNWALGRGYVKGDASGGAYTGDTPYAAGKSLLHIPAASCDIRFSGGQFSPKTRSGSGGAQYSMAKHPVVTVTWHGAVMFCNWLSEMEGLAPAYDTTTWDLIDADAGAAGLQYTNGYRLPTEAEWERAAGWNGTTHWIYGFQSDSISSAKCNYSPSVAENPMGLTDTPYTSPVDWFNGANISPNHSVATANSVSPVGAYGMSGNASEWCHDRYQFDYYTSAAATNPMGPATGAYRARRGGSWNDVAFSCCVAYRDKYLPGGHDSLTGFRVARDPLGPAPTPRPTPSPTSPPMPSPTQHLTPSPTQYLTPSPTLHPTTSPTAHPTPSPTPAVLMEMISVPAGPFIMGTSGRGDDAEYGDPDETPTHTITLSAYQIGKYAITNGQYCDVLNWALARGYVTNSAGGLYTHGDVYGAGEKLLYVNNPDCQITFSSGTFALKTCTGTGGNYSRRNHPVVCVSWYGSVVFCNWLSEQEGYISCYDLTSWTLILGNDGYRLPTEAEWERAAAWDGAKHWIYGFQSETLTGKDRCNYGDQNPDYVNPLGLTSHPYTSPVGWFNGANISPNGNIHTANSPSPVGCFDMSGNVRQWCHDWYDPSFYSRSAMTNPLGASSGSYRLHRGGDWDIYFFCCRAADRAYFYPGGTAADIGFRVARGTFAPAGNSLRTPSR